MLPSFYSGFRGVAIWALVLLTTVLYGQSQSPGPATQLYLGLANAELDPQRVYRVREASLDRPGIQITLNDGNIAFTRDIEGRITGAFFEGDGNLLISPPNSAERASLGLFTGSAILSDEFTGAYLRFDSDVAAELKPALRPFSDEADQREFYQHAAPIAHSLAESDAMRLLVSFVNGHEHGSQYLHLRVSGTSHGTYDVYFDSAAHEPVLVAQAAQVKEGLFLDMWTSFKPGTPRRRVTAEQENEPAAELNDEEVSAGSLRVTDFRIRAHVLPPRQLDAEAEVSLEIGAAPRRLIVFELSQFLKVSSVAVIRQGGDEPIEFLQNPPVHGSQRERRGNDVVAVVLPATPAPNEKVQLRFKYSGDVLSDAGGGLLYVGARGNWFPNRGLSFAKFDMEFRYPQGWTLVATGNLVSESNHEGEQVSRWASQQPMQTAGFNLGQYTRAATSAGNVAVAAYASNGVERSFPKPMPSVPIVVAQDSAGRRVPVPITSQEAPFATVADPAPAIHAAELARGAAHTVDWLSARLGPFPYSSLWITQKPGEAGQGWPGLIYLSSFAFLSPDERARERMSEWTNLFYSKLMVPHEIAHQWWGDELGWKSYHDQWLMEALANYMALLSIEQGSEIDFRAALDHYRNGLLEKNSAGEARFHAGPVTLGPRLTSSKFPGAYDAIVYGRGTWLIHMLRNLLRDAPTSATRKTGSGDELFFTALRRLCEQHRFGFIGNLDVQRAFESVLPPSLAYENRRSLDWFFDTWVNGTAIPRFDLDDVKFGLRAGRPSVTARLLQKDAPDDLVSAIPIYAAGVPGSKPVLLGRVFTEGPETAFHFTVPAGTKKLLVDPYQTVLRQP